MYLTLVLLPGGQTPNRIITASARREPESCGSALLSEEDKCKQFWKNVVVSWEGKANPAVDITVDITGLHIQRRNTCYSLVRPPFNNQGKADLMFLNLIIQISKKFLNKIFTH